MHHLDEIIPKSHSRRTIVLCFDGTGDQFSTDVRTTFFKGIPQLIWKYQELQYRSVLLHAEEGQQI